MPNPLGDSPVAEANPLGDSEVAGNPLGDAPVHAQAYQPGEKAPGMTDEDAAFLKDLSRNSRTEGSFQQKFIEPAAQQAMTGVNLPDIPEGVTAAAGPEGEIAGALYQGVVKPAVSAVTSPATLAIAPLGVADAAGSVLAKVVGRGVSGAFATDMLKSSTDEAKQAVTVLRDPKATEEQKMTAVAKAAATLGFGVLAGAHATSGVIGEPDMVKAREELNAKLGENPLGDKPAPEPEAAPAGNPLGDQPAEVPLADRARYEEIQPQMLAAAKSGDHETLAKLFKENEDIKNRNSSDPGMPPEAPDEAPTTDSEAAKAQEAPPTPAEGPTNVPPLAEPGSLINAVTDQERENRGMEPYERTPVSDATTHAEAMKRILENPDYPKNLVDDLLENPRPADPVERMVLAHRKIDLEGQFDRVARQLNDTNGDVSAKELEGYRQRLDTLSQNLNDLYDVAQKAASASGSSLRATQFSLNRDFSLASMVRERQAVANDGAPLSDEQLKSEQAWHDKIAEVQKKFDDYKSRMSELLQSDEPARPPTTRSSRIVQALSDRADAARERIKARMAEGRVSSGIDPLELKDYAEIGAYHIAKGIEDFGEWSKAMLAEFGDRIQPHLQAIFDQSKQVQSEEEIGAKEAVRLKSFKTRTANRTAELQDKIESGDFSPKPKPSPLQLDPEAIKLKADLDRTVDAYRESLETDRLAKRSPFEKVVDGFLDIRRTGLISGIKTAGKVGMAGLTRPLVTAADTAAGSVLNRLPYIRDIAEQAPREGNLTGHTVENLAKGYVQGWRYAAEQAANVLKTGKTDAEVAAGSRAYRQTLLNYLANTHALEKLTAFGPEYKTSLLERTAHEMKIGTDMTDPINQMRVNNQAVADGLRAKFQQDNFVTNRLNMLYSSLRNAKEHPTAAKLVEKTLRFLLPVVKIPTNWAVEAATYSNMGLGLPRALKMTRDAAKGIGDELTPSQADSIMRHWKKGAIGAGLMTLGYVMRNNIGGYYQPGTQPKGAPQFGVSELAG